MVNTVIWIGMKAFRVSLKKFMNPTPLKQKWTHRSGTFKKSIFAIKALVNLLFDFTIWGFFLGGVMKFFQSHSKGLYTDPNDCMNHPK